jgi:RNA polymerase sigma-70 factor (ECF subfamily)
MPHDDMNQDVFQADRRRLFSIAYRMLGSASDADDVLQDAWLRYWSVDPLTIRAPQSLATTIVTRLCLDRLKSARMAREAYIGPWLPEPVLTSEFEDPDATLQRSESVTLAFLVLLEALSPEERAVFVLKDVFEYKHTEVAGMLGTSPENSRQLLHRAKARLAKGGRRLTGTVQASRAVAERFARAFATGDGPALKALLRGDVGLWSDGGGKASAARRPLAGCDVVQNFLVGLWRAGQVSGDAAQATLRIKEINSEPALVLHVRGRLESIFVLSIDGEAVSGIRIIRNPDKLAHVDRRLRKH